MAMTEHADVPCLVCGAVGDFNELDEGFVVCNACGTQATNVSNEVAEISDTMEIKQHTRRSGAPGIGEAAKRRAGDAASAARKRPRNLSPIPSRTLGQPPPLDGGVWVGTAILGLQSKALAAATGELWLEEEATRLWSIYAASVLTRISAAESSLHQAAPPAAAVTTTTSPAADNAAAVAAAAVTLAAGPAEPPTVKLPPKKGADPAREGIVPVDTLVALCCIALRQYRSSVLLAEVVTLCLSGVVPYYDAFERLEPVVQAKIKSEHYPLVRPLRVLTTTALAATIDKVRSDLQIGSLPPPNWPGLIRRLGRQLRLPPTAAQAALALVESVPPSTWVSGTKDGRRRGKRKSGTVFSAEKTVAVDAAAYVFVALKASHGVGSPSGIGAAGTVEGLGSWFNLVGEPRLGRGTVSSAEWSRAGCVAAGSRTESTQRCPVLRPWQSVGVTYTERAAWVIGDVQLTPKYLRWCGDIFVPASRRSAFRQKHCQELHDLGQVIGKIARTAQANGAESTWGQSPASPPDSDPEPAEGMSATATTATGAIQPEFSRLIADSDATGTLGEFTESLRLVGRVLATHVLETEPHLYERVYRLETALFGPCNLASD